MKKLKNIIYSNIRNLAAVMMLIILALMILFQFLSAQSQARNNAEATFIQVEQIMDKNQEELVAIEESYRETCLLNAKTISYVIEKNPAILGNIEEFRQLARKMQVDEIHIFDDTGKIFTGTHPEYFNYTFDSGEQMNFFKPMLQDKTLELCQDITPNTAEKKLVQYSALWSDDGRYIIQVGMYPEAVLETTEKNELSYIFSLLKGNPGVSLYAIDSSSGVVVGSTSGIDNGRKYSALGFDKIDIDNLPKPAHLSVNGVRSYCIFENVNDTVIVYVTSTGNLYSDILSYTAILALFLLAIALVFILAVQKFNDSYIISSISIINEKLRTVSKGDLDERIEISTSLEFSELSSHINHMIGSLISNTDKMSFILKSTHMLVGVYEYNLQVKNVRFTERVPEILGLDEETTKLLCASSDKTREYIELIKEHPVLQMEKTYSISGESEKYIKLEEKLKGNDIIGIVIDVTDEVLSLKRAEEERDIDILTGLYNRRGLERVLDRMFYVENTKFGSGALIMIDLDDMKVVNDTYGHAIGDGYLQGFAKILKSFDAPEHIAARIGGDEFVLFVYGYENDEVLSDAFVRLKQLQDTELIKLEGDIEILLKFSFGYRIMTGSRDYNRLLSSADEYMYTSKRLRKKMPAEPNSSES